MPTDGMSLRPWLEQEAGTPTVSRPGVLLQYAGDDEVPPWSAVRTHDFTFVRNADGTVELYDLTGAVGPADPHEVHNRAGTTPYVAVAGAAGRLARPPSLQRRPTGRLRPIVQPQGPLIRPAGPRRPTRQEIARRRMFAALVLVLVVGLVWFLWPRGDSPEQAGGKTPGGGKHNGGGNGGNDDVGVIVPGQNPIKHVVFMVKENRSFDHYFGKYPGVDGATEGGTMNCSTLDGAETVPLTAAPQIIPHDLGHAFYPGLLSINGGEMNGFNCVSLGEDMTGYSQYDRDSLPAYYSYADRFVVADHFFTSMYGPTFPEHLYTVAAQSYGIVDNKTTTDTEGNYCDDPLEYTQRFPIEDLTDARHQADHGAWRRTSRPIRGQLLKIAAYWEQTRTCINIPVLPDELEDARHQLEVLRQRRCSG